MTFSGAVGTSVRGRSISGAARHQDHPSGRTRWLSGTLVALRRYENILCLGLILVPNCPNCSVPINTQPHKCSAESHGIDVPVAVLTL